MQRRIYLDHNAGAPLLLVARAAMLEAIEHSGNPSSLHAEGRSARQLVERARNQVAELLGAAREEVVLTSGGTEADQLGIIGLAQRAARQGRPRAVVTSKIEHPAIQGAVEHLVRERGWQRIDLEVSARGELVLPDEATGAGLVALSWVNHELGVVQDAEAIAGWAARAGALCFLDAVQAAGKLSLRQLPRSIDGLSVSSHKLGGPKGAGAVRLGGDAVEALPLFEGGHQERGRRPGTENAVAIAGFGAAAAAADPASWSAVTALGERLEAGLLALPGVRIHGGGAARLGGTVNAGFSGARGESLVMALDLAGFSVSTGAACSSGSVQPSPVLLGIGLSAEAARQAVRFSLGHGLTADDIDAALAALPAIVERARRFG
jgi:cysteine desulfurase